MQASVSRTAVVLDDDATCSRLLAAILGRAGFTPLVAANCCEVQCYADHQALEVAILDLFLCAQGCRGVDIALRLRRTHPGVRVLFVSGTALGDWCEEDQRKAAALGSGSYDMLTKPFTSAAFLSKLQELTSRPFSAAGSTNGCPHDRECHSLNPTGTGWPAGDALGVHKEALA